MNIPRLRRGRKRRRSDPQQSSGSSVSWAERFASEELHHYSGSGSGSGSGGRRSYDIQQLHNQQQHHHQQQQQQQQLRRASTNTMPELWRFQHQHQHQHQNQHLSPYQSPYQYPYENNLPGSGSSGEEMELASSAYLNSLMGRRESMPVSFPRHLTPGHANGYGPGQEGGGMQIPNILDPSLRTASPLMYPTYPPAPSQFEYDYDEAQAHAQSQAQAQAQIRRSITPLGMGMSGHSWQSQNSTVGHQCRGSHL